MKARDRKGSGHAYLVLVWTSIAVVCTFSGRGITSGADQGAFDRIQSWVTAEKQRSGYLPGVLQLAEKIAEFRGNLTSQQVRNVWSAWFQAQRPQITPDQLVQALTAKRRAIETARFRFTVQDETRNAAGVLAVSNYKTCDYLMKGNKVKISSRSGRAPDRLGRLIVRSYDGEVSRTYMGPEDAVLPTGRRDKPRPLSEYIEFDSPLALQMLVDSKAALRQKFFSIDLPALLDEFGQVLEKPETVNGRKALQCIQGAAPVTIVSVDPERNFAVLSFQNNVMLPDVAGVLTLVTPRSVCDCSLFQDCGYGIWLPRRAQWTQWSVQAALEGRQVVEQRREVEVNLMEINKPVDDAEFIQIFAPGTPISDHIAAEDYHAGTVDDVDRALSSTIEELKEKQK